MTTLRISPEISVDDAGVNYTWAEVHLDDVEASAEGPPRVENARAVVRMWFDDKHFDVPYADVVSTWSARGRCCRSASHTCRLSNVL